MTVDELIKALSKYPPDARVELRLELNNGHGYWSEDIGIDIMSLTYRSGEERDAVWIYNTNSIAPHNGR